MVDDVVGKRLWAAADQLWANTSLKPAEFSAPVLGLIFLRYAERKYAITEEKLGPVGSGGRRTVSRDDYLAERVIFLPETARPSYLLSLTDASNDSNRKISENETLLRCFSGELSYRPHAAATSDQYMNCV